MTSERDEPNRTPDTGLGTQTQTPKVGDDVLGTVIKPADGPQEIVDAARDESEIPSDETNEG